MRDTEIKTLTDVIKFVSEYWDKLAKKPEFLTYADLIKWKYDSTFTSSGDF